MADPKLSKTLAALAEAARIAEAVLFAVTHNLIPPPEAYERLTLAHQLRTEAVAKLPANHPAARACVRMILAIVS